MLRYLLTAALILLASCAIKSTNQGSPAMMSMQIIDRNGFSETISVKDRLTVYENVDFATPQPYQKVLRVYAKDSQGRSSSKITSYHSNGQLWQYLEIVDGRAHGKYCEWYSNGKQKIDALVIEGTPDISDLAHATWLFEGKSRVWDEDGHLVAEFAYDKGVLETPSYHYHPNGQISQIIPYHQHQIEGAVLHFDENGAQIEKILYQKGLRQGKAVGYWKENTLKYEEDYDRDLLLSAKYYDAAGSLISQIENGYGKQAIFAGEKIEKLIEFRSGQIEGKIEIFSANGDLKCSYTVKDGKKNGEEWEYYSPSKESSKEGNVLQPKLYLFWHDDVIQGVVKTWYENGTMESQREINNNKKQGMSFAWFRDGSLMLVEDYENELLTKGSYYKKGDKVPVSKIENGKGTATLYNSDGLMIKKIPYEKGRPANLSPQ